MKAKIQAIFTVLALVGTIKAQSINVTSTGVGIGTTAPATPLHVSTGGVIASTVTGTAFGPSGLLALRNTNVSTGWNFGIETGSGWASGTEGSFYLDKNGVGPQFSVTPAGNVGIGTPRPNSRLSVWGGVAEINTSNLSGAEVMDWPFAALTIRRFDDYTQMKMLQFGHVNDSSYQLAGSVWGFSLLDNIGSKVVSDVNTGFAVQGPGNLSLIPNGNVGVGTVTPNAKLDVLKSSPSDGSFAFPNGEWAARILNRVDHPSQNGLIVANRWKNSQSTAFAVGSMFDFGQGFTIFFKIDGDGNVGIGTTNLSHKLTVNGQVKSRGYITDTSAWADYVFAPDYKLPSLNEVEAHIKTKGHLPDVPSEAELVSNGLDLGKMSATQMAQIEQLMLHVIALNKQVQAQAEQVSYQAEEIRKLKSQAGRN